MNKSMFFSEGYLHRLDRGLGTVVAAHHDDMREPRLGRHDILQHSVGGGPAVYIVAEEHEVVSDPAARQPLDEPLKQFRGAVYVGYDKGLHRREAGVFIGVWLLPTEGRRKCAEAGRYHQCM